MGERYVSKIGDLRFTFITKSQAHALHMYIQK